MRGAELDERVAEALLEGRVHDLPEDEWAGVARALEPLRALPAPSPPPTELLDRMQEATGRRRRGTATVWRRPRTALAGLAGAVVVVAGFGGLAAADALPSGLQRFVSDTLDHVGISVPSPADHDRSPGPGHPTGRGGNGGGGTSKSNGASTPTNPDGTPASTAPADTGTTGGSAPTTDGSSTHGSPSKGSGTKPSTPGATNPGASPPRGSSPTAPGQTGDHGNSPGTPPGATNPNNASNGKGQQTLGTPATTSAPGNRTGTTVQKGSSALAPGQTGDRGNRPVAPPGPTNPNAGGANGNGGGGGPPATTGNGALITRGPGQANGRP